MIHSLLLARDCETTTSSSSFSQLYPCPGSIDHDHGALPVSGQEQEEDNGKQEQSVKHDGRSDASATNLLKSSKPDRGGQGTTIKLSLSDPTISLLPFKPIHDDSSSRNSGRVCVDCNTTKTPLWRSGPKGPKSLCNACGIRHRKARRALGANSAGDDPSKFQAFHRSNLKRPKLQQHLDPTATSKKRTKTSFSGYSRCSSDKKLQQKGSHQLCFHMENLHVGSDHHEKEELYYDTNSFRRVFPKDEEEAAVLLMALSCGLVHG